MQKLKGSDSRVDWKTAKKLGFWYNLASKTDKSGIAGTAIKDREQKIEYLLRVIPSEENQGVK